MPYRGLLATDSVSRSLDKFKMEISKLISINPLQHFIKIVPVAIIITHFLVKYNLL